MNNLNKQKNELDLFKINELDNDTLFKYIEDYIKEHNENNYFLNKLNKNISKMININILDNSKGDYKKIKVNSEFYKDDITYLFDKNEKNNMLIKVNKYLNSLIKYNQLKDIYYYE